MELAVLKNEILTHSINSPQTQQRKVNQLQEHQNYHQLFTKASKYNFILFAETKRIIKSINIIAKIFLFAVLTNTWSLHRNFYHYIS